jgi:hypothetical protein
VSSRSLRRRLPPLPKGRSDLRLVARTVRLVLGVPRYAIGAVGSAVASLFVYALSLNAELAWFALTGPLPPENRVTILVEQLPFVGTTFSAVSGTLLVVVAALTGINLAVAAYHLLRHGGDAGTAGTGLVGVALGVLGAGCAACGAAVLAALLSLFGAAGLVTLLPLEGLEVALVAAVALLLSLYWLAEGMRGAEINGCPVDV